jgi:hypothetical protein
LRRRHRGSSKTIDRGSCHGITDRRSTSPFGSPSSTRFMRGVGVSDAAVLSLPLSERKYRSCGRTSTVQRDGPAIIFPALLRITIQHFNSMRAHVFGAGVIVAQAAGSVA